MTYTFTSLAQAEADLRHAEMRIEDADGPWARSQERASIAAIKAAAPNLGAVKLTLGFAPLGGPTVRGIAA